MELEALKYVMMLHGHGLGKVTLLAHRHHSANAQCWNRA